MAKLILEANRMLTKQVDVNTSEAKVVDKDALEKRLASIRGEESGK